MLADRLKVPSLPEAAWRCRALLSDCDDKEQTSKVNYGGMLARNSGPRIPSGTWQQVSEVLVPFLFRLLVAEAAQYVACISWHVFHTRSKCSEYAWSTVVFTGFSQLSTSYVQCTKHEESRMYSAREGHTYCSPSRTEDSRLFPLPPGIHYVSGSRLLVVAAGLILYKLQYCMLYQGLSKVYHTAASLCGPKNLLARIPNSTRGKAHGFGTAQEWTMPHPKATVTTLL